MHSIYSLGEVCYIWLGECNEASGFTIQHLKDTAKYQKRLPVAYVSATDPHKRALERRRLLRNMWQDMIYRFKSEHLRRFRTLNRKNQNPPVFLENIPLPFTDKDEWIRVQDFFQLPWFHRMWTFQEIIMSKNPLLICGDNTLEWEDIANLVWFKDSFITMPLDGAFGDWVSIVQMWFDFPRDYNRPQAHAQQSFRDLFYKTPIISLSAPRMPRILFQTLAGFIYLVPGLLILVSGIVIAVVLVRSRDGDARFLAVFPIAAVISIAVLLLTQRSLQVVFDGITSQYDSMLETPTPYHDSATPNRYTNTNELILDGVWSALRNRECSDLRDKSFGLLGILKGSGASPPTPVYSQSVREVYQSLFESLVLWNPGTVTLIVNAGIQNLQKPTWPSWLPDWTRPKENSWLVDQLHQGRNFNTTGRQQLRHIKVSHNMLRLKGLSKGSVTSIFRFEKVATNPSQSDLIPNLLKIRDCILDMCTSEYGLTNTTQTRQQITICIQNTLFGIIEGIVGHEETKVIELKMPDYSRSERSWQRQIPVNYLYHLQEMEDFLSFFHTIDNSREGSANTLLTKLQSKPTAFPYFIRIINKIVDEKRCLFKLSSGLIGSGTLDLAAGDEVFLVPGVRVPLAVRRNEGHRHILIGPVHAPGVMQGKNYSEQNLAELHLV
ncbi:hypothetical protein F4860DRAFT_362404 [Xylaria cubensis]|nr:hypothetical protein F4860DRAFT_362404 [Xylaria cubensis]